MRKFSKCSDGAVTVDWVVMTAAVVGLGLVVMTILQDKPKPELPAAESANP